MGGIFALEFILLKIGIQAAILTAIIFFVVRLVNKKRIEKNDRPLLKLGCFSFFVCVTILVVALFFLSQAYWFDRGFGDTAIIPVGHNAAIMDIDGSGSYLVYDDFQSITVSPNGDLAVNKFIQQDYHLYGSNSEKYFVVDLKTRKAIDFSSEAEYNEYARQYKLPLTDSFKEFRDNYLEYWDGWRFWLLP